ncbi:zinc-binding dehydrogenase [Antrihabitans cavernicola]|uniref:Zinc-binding dehydrogenase n=1 Tax=Antrihabitans cavernicola TaxID=2495913 RepID=A0A5A7S7C1_9NOCA|nr:zinc-binding dehydrogenase [Spelaeibacter cavernicola]KAA0018458.1 zinc-binding dehydrogenase [Spelaeibacter cavernicola]
MKALTATGDRDLIAPSDLPEPTPAPDEAIVQVEAFSVNRGEIFLLTGVYGTPAEPGRPMGQDVAGRVIRAAADGTGPAVGQRVVGHPAGGGWAERVAVPVCELAPIPDSVATTTAAALPLAGLTALRLVREAGSVLGKRILVTGASGGVGHYVVELAVGAGAHVTAVTSSIERGSRLRELGAELITDVHDATGTYDLVLESVGGSSFRAAAALVAQHGTLLWFGQASLEPITLDFFDLFANTPITIKHFPHFVSDVSDADDLATLVDLVATGRLHPEIGRIADWADTTTVLDDLNHRRIRGNAVLTIEG